MVCIPTAALNSQDWNQTAMCFTQPGDLKIFRRLKNLNFPLCNTATTILAIATLSTAELQAGKTGTTNFFKSSFELERGANLIYFKRIFATDLGVFMFSFVLQINRRVGLFCL